MEKCGGQKLQLINGCSLALLESAGLFWLMGPATVYNTTKGVALEYQPIYHIFGIDILILPPFDLIYSQIWLDPDFRSCI